MPIVATLLPRADGDGVHLYASGTQESLEHFLPSILPSYYLTIFLLSDYLIILPSYHLTILPFYYLQESLEHFVRLVAQKLMPPLFNMAALF